MSTITSLPSFSELTEALEKTDAPLQAAEVHGLLCGIICATSAREHVPWENLVLGPTKNAQTTELLKQLYASSYQQMSEFAFEFALVLPADDADITLRAENLGLWCQGFLIGLQQSKTPIEERATPEVVDAINDITEISQVTYEGLASTDEDETAYFELAEYIRLVVLMIYHDLRSLDKTTLSGGDNLLH